MCNFWVNTSLNEIFGAISGSENYSLEHKGGQRDIN